MATEKRERKRANREARLTAAMAAQAKAKRKSQIIRIVLMVGLALLLSLIYWLVSRDDNDEGATTDTTAAAVTTTTPTTGASITGETPCPPAEGATERVTTFAEAPPMCIDPAKTYTATFETSAGNVTATLDTTKTPETVNNFVVLARYGYYDDSAFFRTDPSIGIIQGGGLNNTQDPGYTIPDEGSGFTYKPGDLVMARTGQPNSAGAQFFFAVDAAVSALDTQGTYVTFGEITEGFDVLEAILATHKADPSSQLGGAPDPPVTVSTVTIVES